MRNIFKALAGLLMLVCPSFSQAVTCSASAVCEVGVYTFHNSDGTTPASLYTATGNGAKITGIFCNSNQTTPSLVVTAYINRLGVAYPYFSTGFNITSGNTVSIANLLLYSSFGYTQPFLAVASNPYGLPTDENANPYLLLASGDSLQVGLGTTLTSPYFVTCEAEITQY